MRYFVLSFHFNNDGCFMTYAGKRWLSWPLCDVTYGTSTWTRNSWAAASVVQDQKRRRRRRRSFGCLRTFSCKGLGFFFMFPHVSAWCTVKVSRRSVICLSLSEFALCWQANVKIWSSFTNVMRGFQEGLQHRVCVQLPEHGELNYLINTDAHIPRHVD